MRKSITVIVMLVVSLALSGMIASAQDNNGDGGRCDVDLSTAGALIVQAQAEASGGQRDSAVRTMALARQVLADAMERCGGNPDMAVEMGIVLEQAYDASNDTFAFQLPQSWAIESVELYDDGGVVYAGDSPRTIDSLTGSDPVLESGQQGLAVLVGAADDIGFGFEDDATLTEIVDEFVINLTEEASLLTEPQQFSINDLPAMRFEVTGEGFDAVFIIVEQMELARYGIILFVASTGELEAARPLAQAIAESLTFGE